MAGRDERDLVCAYRAARCLDTGDRSARAAQEPRDFRVFDDVHAALAGAGRERPRDPVVAGSAAPPLQRAAHHRVAHVGRDVDDRAELLHLLRVEHLGVDPLQVVRLDAPVRAPHLADVVQDVQHALLVELEIPVEVVLEALPQFQGVLVDRGGCVPQVVRADHRRVAGDVAAGEPTLLDDADVRDAVVLGEVVGRRKAVPAAAHDDHVVGILRLGVTPVALRFVAHRVGGSLPDPSRGGNAVMRAAQHSIRLRNAVGATIPPSTGRVAGCATKRAVRCSP